MKKIFIIYLICLFFISGCGQEKYMDNENNILKKYNLIREPAVAGAFYPDQATEIQKKIDQYFENIVSSESLANVKAIMVPHAGYDYSGQVAANAYKMLIGQKVDTVVLMSNSHSTYFSGIAIDNSDVWQTPLGLVGVDKELAGKLEAKNEVIKFNKEVHAHDHTLEVQLPFLQTVLGNDFKIVPILFGNTVDGAYKQLAQALKDNLGGNDLVLVSTDLSHYPSYEDAETIDRKTLQIIQTADINKLEKHISDIINSKVPNEQTLCCGIDAVKTVMELFNVAAWESIRLLKYANSGDVSAGDKSRVVGYGSLAFLGGKNKVKLEEENIGQSSLNSGQQKMLLDIVRRNVEAKVLGEEAPEFAIIDERLNSREGAFVTLRKQGELRGCIGQIIPGEKPLWQVVRDMAIAACSEDHRFEPVSKDELGKLQYEISVLSAPRKIDNWQDIELGKHGVIVRKGMRTGVFLPQVADEAGWSLEEFLNELCWQKAGLAPDCYKNDKEVELLVFSAQVFE